MPDYQIMLLPRNNYFRWVAAARDYVIRYGVNLTPEPDTAGRFGGGQQVITVAVAPGEYPQGDIVGWFGQNYPNVMLDPIEAPTPEDLKAVLAARLAANDRYGRLSKAFRLAWPTEYPKITQPFGANPDIYRRWNLPGHEGVDIRAPDGARIFACAAGTVFQVHDGRDNHPYGVHVRIQHADGYQTIYAHLREALVQVNDVVKAGQVIGLADSTGNSSGSHLHLTLKKAGATAAGLTNYRSDIIDPTPFLVFPGADLPAPGGDGGPRYDWPPGKCLVGVHGRADGPMLDPDFEAVRVGRVEAVKLLSTARPEDVDRLRQINLDMFIMVRLFASFRDRVVRADEFASWVEADMAQFYARGVRYFEVHNEPNLQLEGWTLSWTDGRLFGAWFRDVVVKLRLRFPEAKFGFPGLSPGDNISGQRMNALAFLSGADEAVRGADWVGVHCYWSDEVGLNSPGEARGYEEYRRRFPNQLLFITEYSNPAQSVNPRTKGQQYVRYFKSLRDLPGVGAAFSFVVSASAGFAWEVWRLEDGRLTDIPALVGARDY